MEKADIIISTTRGKGSLIEAEWIKPGTHIVAVGTDQKGKQEYEPEIFKNSKIVCDSISQCVEKVKLSTLLKKILLLKLIFMPKLVKY